MNDYKIPLRRKFLIYVEGGQPVPPPPPPRAVWLEATTSASDAAAIGVFYRAGLCENEDKIYVDEANEITTLPAFSSIANVWTGFADWSPLANVTNFVQNGFNNVKLTNIPPLTNAYQSATMMRVLFNGCRQLVDTQLPVDFAKNADIWGIFNECNNIALTSLPSGFGAIATNYESIFYNCRSLALTSLNGEFSQNAITLYQTFANCINIRLTALNDNFGAVATNMNSTFSGCSSLALTALNDIFGAVATSMNSTFLNCSSLALTALNDNFGAVATNMNSTFSGCSSLALTALNDIFGAVATNMNSTFLNCSSLALTALNDNFGAVATSMNSTFLNCSSLALTALNDNFGKNCNYYACFGNCHNIALTSLPPSFASAIILTATFQNCEKIRGSFNLNSSNFGQNCTNFARCFLSTNITSFSGYFDFSRVNNDTLVISQVNAIEQFIPVTCTHVMFVANTLKYSLVNSAANLTNIDTESLLSLAECLSSSASGKTWTVTSAQFDTLMSEMYSETLSYIMYVMMKGWNVESA